MTESTTDAAETAETPPPRFRCLAYLDGPLTGRTALAGWRTDDDIPEHLTATVGIRHHPNYRVETAPGVWLDTVAVWTSAAVAEEGRPVRYQLEDGGYRFAGEGTWPEHEIPEEELAETFEEELAETFEEDWEAEHEEMD